MECPLPGCGRQFHGRFSQRNFNLHARRLHPEFHRAKIQLPRKRASRRKADVPAIKLPLEEEKKAKAMIRLKEKARSNQIVRIEFAAHPRKPYRARVGDSNPFFVVEHELKIFIGVTKEELLVFPVVETLKNYQVDPRADGAAHKIEVIAKALLELEEIGIETLAASYHFYRKALLAMEDYPAAVSSYNNRTLVGSGNQAALEACIDEACVEVEAEEMYDLYLKNVVKRGKKKELSLNRGSDKTSIESTANTSADIGISIDSGIDPMICPGIGLGADSGIDPMFWSDIWVGVDSGIDPMIRSDIGVGGDFQVDPQTHGAWVGPALYPGIELNGDWENDNWSDIGGELSGIDLQSPENLLTSEVLQELKTQYPVYTSSEEAFFLEPRLKRSMDEELLQSEFTLLTQ
ncbi:hypothetical protein Q9L58_009659 [Maublancomyces gigas]|uniref:C2H2-type domain-containing protein n=1 Tax=Discina gigas TaxID=1032678 RepID=A0ABR3G697_9PEZI